MGRNVFGSMGDFFGFGIRQIIVFVLFFAITISAYADDQVEKGQCVLTFENMFGNISSIKVTDVDNVTRVYPDSTKVFFTRTVEYYLTKLVKNPPEDGFQTISVTVDSVRVNVSHPNGAGANDPVKSKLDRTESKKCTCIDGKSFDITYSPYGEIAKIFGQDLDWIRNNLDENRSSMGEEDFFDWEQCLSDKRIAFIADMKKILLPQGLIPTDTIWTSPIEFQADNKTFSDTVACKIVKIDQSEFNISTSSLSLNNIIHTARYYGFEKIGNINSIAGAGALNITLSKRGILRKTALEYSIITTNTVDGRKFTDRIDTKTTWELLKTIRY